MDSGRRPKKAPEIYTTTSMQYMSVLGRQRCCEVAVSGAYRWTGYFFTNCHLSVLHANTDDISSFKYVIPVTLENIELTAYLC